MRRSFTLVAFMYFASATVQADVYVFPVTPASPEWGTLSMEERIQSQQIPDERIESMTTREVYEAFLSLPSLIRILEYPAIQDGFERMRESYNVIAAMMRRGDIGHVVVQHYLSTVIDQTNNADFDYQFSIDMTALVLSQPEILSELAIEEKKEVMAHALSILESNALMSNSTYWPAPTLALMGRILLYDEHASFMTIVRRHPGIESMLNDGVLLEVPNRLEMADVVAMTTEYIGQ